MHTKINQRNSYSAVILIAFDVTDVILRKFPSNYWVILRNYTLRKVIKGHDDRVLRGQIFLRHRVIMGHILKKNFFFE